MKVRYFKIAGGNDTALIWNAKDNQKSSIAKQFLKTAEQVGFVDEKPTPILTMMGDELCINAALATAYSLGAKGKLFLDGVESSFTVSGNKVQLRFSLPYKTPDEKTVTFDGIGYRIGMTKASKSSMLQYCNKYRLPAFGLIYLFDNMIQPYIYVKKTNSLVKETACGSGSVAVSILTGKKDVIQPTGKTIKVSRREDEFILEAEVLETKI